MITGTNFILRPWHEKDLSCLTKLRNNVSLQSQLLSHVRGSNNEQTRQWLQNRSSTVDSLLFIIAENDTDFALGYIQFAQIDLIHRYAKLGICLSPESQGRGIGSEAIILSHGYLYTHLRLRKSFLEVRSDNLNAIRCYEKIGFKKCGLLRDHVFLEGRLFDVILMEMKLSNHTSD